MMMMMLQRLIVLLRNYELAIYVSKQLDCSCSNCCFICTYIYNHSGAKSLRVWNHSVYKEFGKVLKLRLKVLAGLEFGLVDMQDMAGWGNISVGFMKIYCFAPW